MIHGTLHVVTVLVLVTFQDYWAFTHAAHVDIQRRNYWGL